MTNNWHVYNLLLWQQVQPIQQLEIMECVLIYFSIVTKAREDNDNDDLKIDTSLDNGPPSPLLPPQQRRRLSSIKDAKKIPQSHVIKVFSSYWYYWF